MGERTMYHFFFLQVFNSIQSSLENKDQWNWTMDGTMDGTTTYTVKLAYDLLQDDHQNVDARFLKLLWSSVVSPNVHLVDCKLSLT